AQALTTDEILAHHLTAVGGADALHAIRTLRMSGKVQLGGGDFSLEARYAEIYARDARVRTEFTLQGLTQVEAYDGRDGWRFSPFGGRREAERASADESKALAEDA